MADPNLEFEQDVSSAERPLESTTADQPQAAQAPAFTLEDVKKLLAEQGEQQRKEFDAQLQEVKRQKDRARETAYRKAGAFETETLPILKELGVELDPRQVREGKRLIVDRQFETPEAQEPETVLAQTPAPVKTEPPVVGQDAAILAFLNAKGVNPQQIGGVEKYRGMLNGSDLALAFDEAVLNAQKANRTHNKREQNAERRGAELAEFGAAQDGIGAGQARGGQVFDPYANSDATLEEGLSELFRRR